MLPQLTLADIKAERRVISREWTKLAERLAILIERNEELDKLEKELLGEDKCATS